MSGTTSPVARQRYATPRWLRLLASFGLIVGAAGFLTYMFWGLIAWTIWGDPADHQPAPPPVGGFSMGRALPQQQAAVSTPLPPPQDTKPPPADVSKNAPPAPPDATPTPRMRPMTVLTFVSPLPAAAAAKKSAATGDDDDDAAPGGTGTANDSAYAQSMQATRINDDRPKLHRLPPRYTIRKGLTFDCTPPMPLDTQLPGPLWCDVDHDVYSMDGQMILIPAHSTANATIERGLGLGQDRAILVFTDILTSAPDFLPIPLGSSLGASELGQNGVPVDVNEHTWQKIKTTLMFAGVEFLSSATTAALQHGGNTQYNFGSVSGVGQSLAGIAFQHDMNIPTTGYRGPGRPIKVYVNHYIDLSRFYDIALRRGR